MSILCLGGTFNPPHHGHLICARAAAEVLEVASVTLVPSSRPPHKPADPEIVSAPDRIAMCRRAVEGIAAFDVDDRETRRAGPSYTIDTVRDMKRDGHDRIYWLIGADQLLTLPTWRQADALLAEAEIVVAARPGWAIDWGQLPPPFRRLEKSVVCAPLLEISATDIRRRVREGKSIDFLTPRAVVDYIREQGLYRAS